VNRENNTRGKQRYISIIVRAILKMGNAQYTMEDVFKDTLEENNMSAEMC
jgi:hypothetical protein